jgi:hypothetical protein
MQKTKKNKKPYHKFLNYGLFIFLKKERIWRNTNSLRKPKFKTITDIQKKLRIKKNWLRIINPQKKIELELLIQNKTNEIWKKKKALSDKEIEFRLVQLLIIKKQIN